MTRRKIHEIRLASFVEEKFRPDDFEVVQTEIDTALGDGQVLVKALRFGLNAGLANRISGGSGPSTRTQMAVGEVPQSDAVMEVIESKAESFSPGDLVVQQWASWRTEDVVPASELRRVRDDVRDLPLEYHLTVLGHVGFTGWVGLAQVGQVEPEDVVFVSAASGGVGSCVVQFTAAKGARVIGSAGSAEKAALVEALGADSCINYREGDPAQLLGAAAPDGITLYFDNVGGPLLEAALDQLQMHGRVVICGAVSQYGQSSPQGPSNYLRMISHELTMRGFTVTEHEDLRAAFEQEVGSWIRDRTVTSLHTVFEGFDRVPEAFAAQLGGGTRGRVIVAV
ncbi:NADP-dependent oxidoreductase [Arthrobacter echini]|uniref:NADP-dependent oxidoreductase n=1 Tax=Arthrobacter echini TaxID=1529066 RepID=A0A4S5E404_9MICC|nr:NADP-dependent oxidoreductase [Arthrobacter echini]THJ66178.1 NADP-dependent oxidoreductase [Arthrobacter echini]